MANQRRIFETLILYEGLNVKSHFHVIMLGMMARVTVVP